MTPTKSFTERVFQALGFEGLALLICTPLLVWITGRPALEMGAVTLGISLLALSWNVVFNSLFDRLKTRLQLANGQLKIQANNPEQEEAEEEVGVDYNGASLEIGFNVSYLLDVLGVMTTEQVRLILSDSNSSALVQESDNDDSAYVVMPMRL